MSLPSYPYYKDSGVDWLGKVPAHWQVDTLRRRATLNPSKTEIGDRTNDELASFLPMEAVGEGGELDLSRTRPISEVSNGYTYFREGDVTFAKITPCFENGKGARMVGLHGGIGFGTTELTVIRPLPNLLDGRYLDWVLRSLPFRKRGEAAMYGAGGQKRVPDEFVREFSFAWPGLDEQNGIARFLDRETAKIDALIAEQEKLLALLAEKRQATISHAVTRGLDPNAPMKDSGVPWLGEVPAHWDLVPCRFLVSERDERNDGAANQNYLSLMANVGVIPYAEKGDVGNKKPEDLSKCKLVEVGDLVINSMNYGIGSYGLSPLSGVCSPVYIVLEVKQSAALREFVYRIFQNRGFQLFAQSFGNGILAHRAAIGWDTLKGLQVVLPNLDEQREIVEFVKSVEDTERQMRMEGEQAIALLKERRSALIAAAVTGQIDVRGVVEPEAA